MNLVTKYGVVFSSMFLLAACETPGGSDDMYDGSSSGSGYGQDIGGGTGPGSNIDFIENVGDRVFFGYDSSVVTAEGRNTLEDQARWLNQYQDVVVVVEGHADERGTREYNLALGERRANAARDVLVAAGVNPSRITVISYGKERPAVLGSNERAWAQNRRGVTVLR